MGKSSKKKHKPGWKHPAKTHGKTGEIRIKSLQELPEAIAKAEAIPEPMPAPAFDANSLIADILKKQGQ